MGVTERIREEKIGGDGARVCLGHDAVRRAASLGGGGRERRGVLELADRLLDGARQLYVYASAHLDRYICA